MIEYKAPLSDMRFIMYDVLQIDRQWQQWQALAELDSDTADAILTEGAKLAAQVITPLNRSGDETGCEWVNGNVTTPKRYAEGYQQYIQGGWSSLGGNPEFGGMGMPKALAAQFDEMICSASLAFSLYPCLTAGACLAIDAHADDSIKATFLPNMYAGIWSGTMCLTEPHAGSDLGIIRTKAIPDADSNDIYRIYGTKIFITGGEHDLTENIIHLVLAKLPNAATGAKGISMFLVPKYWLNENGSSGEANGVSCGAIEHKMGINGSATCVMNFDDAKGYLIGEAGKGLNAMFTMMNYERLLVGIQGLGCAEMSYQTALSYAKTRLQGQDRDGNLANLLNHGDVRRMLLNSKVMNEAGRAFSTFVAHQLDRVKYSDNTTDKATASQLVAFLTPIAKAFLTDIGFENCILGQQVLGGHGYVREWGQEQLVRDARIAQIYEGTNGIQALDLVGRKLLADKGAVLTVLTNHMRDSIDPKDSFAHILTTKIEQLEQLSQWLIQSAQIQPELINSCSVEYLNCVAYVIYAWLWHCMDKTATALLAQGSDEKDFLQAKQHSATYYFKHILPRFDSSALIVMNGCEAHFAFDEGEF